MTILYNMPSSSWLVICQNENERHRYTYAFNADKHSVSWTDIDNGMSGGGGSFKFTADNFTISWPSGSKDSWDRDINTEGWSGTCTMGGQAYSMSATLQSKTTYIPVAEGQSDVTACWAASLSWWTYLVSQTNSAVVAKTQSSILFAGSSVVSGGGTLTSNGLMSFFASQSAISADRITTAQLESYMSKVPLLIAFGTDGVMAGHVNVIYSYDPDSKTVKVMEPWYPDPSTNSKYTFTPADEGAGGFYSDKDGKGFIFSGALLTRPLTYYSSKPLQGSLIVSYQSSLR